MKYVVALIFSLVFLCSCQSVTHQRVEESSKWHPYGHLEFYRSIKEPDLIAVMGATSKSSGITILDSKKYSAVEVDVVDLSNSDFSYLGMFKVEADDKPLLPNEEERRSSRDNHYVKPGLGKVTYALPAGYEKVVINFNFGTFRGYRFRFKLLE